MEIGLIGLGKMGSRTAERLFECGFKVVGTDVKHEIIDKIKKRGIIGVYSVAEVPKGLQPPRIVYLLVPSGEPVDVAINELLPGLEKGDIIIDAGNSFYMDSQRRAKRLEERGIFLLDVGTSGGLEGARYGACVMVGGKKEAYEKVKPVFEALTVEDGCKYIGPSGAGHFVKGVHNFIEYGYLGAIAEGLEVIHKVSVKEGFKINLNELCKLWEHGSIIESRLIRDAASAFKKYPGLEEVDGRVFGETHREMEKIIKIAKGYDIQTPVVQAAIHARIDSQTNPRFSSKVINAIRNIFGGHDSKGNSK